MPPPPLLPCHSLDYLSWQLLNQPFIFYIFFSFHPCLPRFSHGVYNYFAVSCAFSPLFRPPRSYPRSRYRRPVPISASVLASVPVPIRCSSTGPHPRPRPALLRSPPPPFPLRPRLRYRLRSHPRLHPAPDPVRSFLSLGVCMYVCVCELHITGQSSPVILIILYHSY